MGSSQDAQTKNIAYLVAPYVLGQANTSQDKEDLLLLTTNIFIKDFKNLSGECVIPSMALNCLSSLMDSELALMMYREITPLFTCSNATIRKKVCALTVKLYQNAGVNQEIMDDIVPLLCDRLKDKDNGV
jgi:vesicle coat complex subunit